MSPGKSPLWRGFDKLERKIGKPLEDVVGSTRYAGVMVQGHKVKRVVGGVLGGAVKGGVGKVLGAVNMPTGNEVQRLSRQLAVLTSEVRALSTTQQQAKRAGAAPAPGTATPAPGTAAAQPTAPIAGTAATVASAPKATRKAKDGPHGQ